MAPAKERDLIDLKVCIVTVYDSINSGSFWQAYALGKVLEGLGHEVCYYKRRKKGASSSPSKQMKQVLRFVKRGKISDAREYLKKVSLFKKQGNVFRVIDEKDPMFSKIDCFVLGSDTIWNLESAYFKAQKSVFWGDIFQGRKVISYAGSVANSPSDLFLPADRYADSVSKWADISVRDAYTEEIFSSFTDRTITRVCDPTLLLDADDYQNAVPPKKGNYVFLYLFEPLSHSQSAALRRFADQKGMKIVIGTKRNVVSNADSYIINSPKRFMEHMLGASYVITDTYHGTIFSANLRKQFIIINREKKKVNELLAAFGLEDRLLSEDDGMGRLLEQPVDYSKANERIRHIKESSLLFLKRNLT